MAVKTEPEKKKSVTVKEVPDDTEVYYLLHIPTNHVMRGYRKHKSSYIWAKSKADKSYETTITPISTYTPIDFTSCEPLSFEEGQYMRYNAYTQEMYFIEEHIDFLYTGIIQYFLRDCVTKTASMTESMMASFFKQKEQLTWADLFSTYTLTNERFLSWIEKNKCGKEFLEYAECEGVLAIPKRINGNRNYEKLRRNRKKNYAENTDPLSLTEFELIKTTVGKIKNSVIKEGTVTKIII
jgi:hypothetical protein